jgi:hydrogenase nickel incorporation protein HypA/HybF
MHELSIACELVDVVEESARAAGALSVRSVHLRLGALAGVEVEALRIGYATAIAGTLLDGARLEIEEAPIRGWCPHCDCERTPVDPQWLACSCCFSPLQALTGGREIEVVAIELCMPDLAGEVEEEAPHVHAFA